MNNPKVKYEAVMSAARSDAGVLADPDVRAVVRTQRLMPDNTIEVHHEVLEVAAWRQRNKLAPFDLEAFMGTFTWKKKIIHWSWIPDAMDDLANLVARAAECMTDEAMDRVYNEAAAAAATLHAALDPLLGAVHQKKSAEPSAEVVDAVREYLKHKDFLEKRGVIKEHYAGYRPRQPEACPDRHTEYRVGCTFCRVRRRKSICEHGLVWERCDRCAEWSDHDDDSDNEDDEDDDDSDYEDSLHPVNLPDTDSDDTGGHVVDAH